MATMANPAMKIFAKGRANPASTVGFFPEKKETQT
jgi:hypothetical protein